MSKKRNCTDRYASWMYNITALRPVVVLAVFTAWNQSFPLSIFIASYLSQHCSIFISLQIKCEELKLENLTILPSVFQLESSRISICFVGFSLKCLLQTTNHNRTPGTKISGLCPKSGRFIEKALEPL